MENDLIFRPGTPEDLAVIMEMTRQAQKGLAERGVDQWQDGYPNEDAFLQDIEQGYCYVAETQERQVLGVCAVIPDGEPDYDVIEDGQWLNDGRYMTVHRVIVRAESGRRGVASYMLGEAAKMAIEQGLLSLRLDTHPDNLRMQGCLTRNGLTRCGVIHLGRDGAARYAYEKWIHLPHSLT